MKKSLPSSRFELTTSLKVRRRYRNDMDRKGGPLRDIDEMFVKQFLKNGNVTTPTESVLISTNEFRALTDSLRENRTYCFKTEPGPWGWCATCKVTSPLSSQDQTWKMFHFRSDLRRARLDTVQKTGDL